MPMSELFSRRNKIENVFLHLHTNDEEWQTVDGQQQQQHETVAACGRRERASAESAPTTP
jgi:hypothetical protein